MQVLRRFLLQMQSGMSSPISNDRLYIAHHLLKGSIPPELLTLFRDILQYIKRHSLALNTTSVKEAGCKLRTRNSEHLKNIVKNRNTVIGTHTTNRRYRIA